MDEPEIPRLEAGGVIDRPELADLGRRISWQQLTDVELTLWLVSRFQSRPELESFKQEVLEAIVWLVEHRLDPEGIALISVLFPGDS